MIDYLVKMGGVRIGGPFPSLLSLFSPSLAAILISLGVTCSLSSPLGAKTSSSQSVLSSFPPSLPSLDSVRGGFQPGPDEHLPARFPRGLRSHVSQPSLAPSSPPSLSPFKYRSHHTPPSDEFLPSPLPSSQRQLHLRSISSPPLPPRRLRWRRGRPRRQASDGGMAEVHLSRGRVRSGCFSGRAFLH